jgi:LCP family protein required for cell wall assembly
VAALGTSRSALLELLVRSDVLALLLIGNVALFLYRAAAIVDAYRIAPRYMARRSSRPALPVLGALLGVSLLAHGAVAVVGVQVYRTLDTIFVPGGPGDDWGIPEPGFSPSPSPTILPSPAPVASPTPSPQPTPTPTPTPSPPPAWATEGRLNLLLIGSDAGPGRRGIRTDTMIVLSVEVATGRAALFGIPRNLVGVPLPAESAGAIRGGKFPGLLNALHVYAMEHPAQFPGGEARGFRAVAGAVQELTGVRLHGMASLNLNGFVRVIDALGGLWIDVPERLVDNNYPVEDGRTTIRIDIRPGCQQLDGRMALAYARSRHQDSDYGRMQRQQTVLLALRRQVDPLVLLPRVVDLLEIAKDDFWTTVPRHEVGDLAELAGMVDADEVTTVTFVPPRYPSHLTDRSIEAIRTVVRAVFDEPTPAQTPGPTESPASCP